MGRRHRLDVRAMDGLVDDARIDFAKVDLTLTTR